MQQARELFEAALEWEPHERDQFLAGACGDDVELRSLVQQLVGHFEGLPADFLNLTPTPGSPGYPPTDQRETLRTSGAAPSRDVTDIEGFQILREIHRGGQGVVYEAHDRITKRKVAIKVLIDGMLASQTARKRFEREVELAANLRHPNIVSILHSGRTPEGHQFCVMDYVRGVPLHEYVRSRRLALENALNLFVAVSEAVHHAHQRGVIHRDLKPSNILVESDGCPKILDFGLAKLIGGPERTVLSHTGQVVGTLPYMSPEQARGNPDEIDVRTDIYALGVILFQLLTGKFPYPVEGEFPDVLRHIAETHPAPPSKCWSAESGITGGSSLGLDACCPISSELDTIVLKSLQKERNRRYQSVEELAGDLRSYLACRPIDAVQSDVRHYPGTVCSVVFCDMVNTARWNQVLGNERFTQLTLAHDNRARQIARELQGEEHGRSDGFRLTFRQPVSGLRFALRYHESIAELGTQFGIQLAGRVAIHCGAIRFTSTNGTGLHDKSGVRDIHGIAVPETIRIHSAALPRQILLSSAAFELAWQEALGNPELTSELVWLRHGKYEFMSAAETEGGAAVGEIELCEVGRKGFAPGQPPRASESIWPKAVTGPRPWRPSPSAEVPNASGWTVGRQLGIASFGEVWTASNEGSGQQCVFWFCFAKENIPGLERELARLRRINRRLGHRTDIVRLLGTNLHVPPYFIQLGYTAQGTLPEWVESRGGWDQVSLPTRVEIVAQTANALAAVHAIGELHRDVSPGNILIEEEDGRLRACLADLGVGRILDDSFDDSSEPDDPSFSRPTMLQSQRWPSPYTAPELAEGARPTTQSDIYALGVVALQILSGDFKRVPSPGCVEAIRHGLVRSRYLRKDVARCLAHAPRERLAPAGLLAHRLRRVDRRMVRDWTTAALFAFVALGAAWLGYDSFQSRAANRRMENIERLGAALDSASSMEGNLTAAKTVINSLEALRNADLGPQEDGKRCHLFYALAWAYKSAFDATSNGESHGQPEAYLEKSHEALDAYYKTCLARAELVSATSPGSYPECDEVRLLCDVTYYNIQGTLKRAESDLEASTQSFKLAMKAESELRSCWRSLSDDEYSNGMQAHGEKLASPHINFIVSSALLGNLRGAGDAAEEYYSELPIKKDEPYLLPSWHNLAQFRSAVGNLDGAVAAADRARTIGVKNGLADGYLVSAQPGIDDLDRAFTDATLAHTLIENSIDLQLRMGRRCLCVLAHVNLLRSDAYGDTLFGCGALEQAATLAARAQEFSSSDADSLESRVLSCYAALLQAAIAAESNDAAQAGLPLMQAQAELNALEADATCIAPPCDNQERFFVYSPDNRYIWFDSYDDLRQLADDFQDGNGMAP